MSGSDGNSAAGPPGPPCFADFAAVVAAGLELAPDTLRPDSLLCGEVCADSLDFYRLYVTLDQWCPGFELPSELELECTTLADTHHFLHQRLGQAPGRS